MVSSPGSTRHAYDGSSGCYRGLDSETVSVVYGTSERQITKTGAESEQLRSDGGQETVDTDTRMTRLTTRIPTILSPSARSATTGITSSAPTRCRLLSRQPTSAPCLATISRFCRC